ncbi:hypothetical protein D5S18_17310 [Nocardia panacis]|uniref:Uncharacterized protein n=1 Tax=Nocardia panacis TaxID=2340916 RepID=A0A3A4KQ39_9NOCA|nr:hypothetical protein D5S18_17310 [Nocardia panacis]
MEHDLAGAVIRRRNRYTSMICASDAPAMAGAGVCTMLRVPIPLCTPTTSTISGGRRAGK